MNKLGSLDASPPMMWASRIHRFGSPEVIELEEIVRPIPSTGEVLVRVECAGVGPWDSLIRRGGSALGQSLPLTLGSDLAGVIESVGPGVDSLRAGDVVYGVTNSLFIGAYAEFAIASASKIAAKPEKLSYAEAASVPVIATTAYQMLFEHAQLRAGQTVLILGATGNVGAFATQMASRSGATVVAATLRSDIHQALQLGADEVIDTDEGSLRPWFRRIDAVIDTIGGEAQALAVQTLKPGGILVSAVTQPAPSILREASVRGVFFYADVQTPLLQELSASLDQGALRSHVGEVLPLRQAHIAHRMLDGLQPRPTGKIVLEVESSRRQPIDA